MAFQNNNNDEVWFNNKQTLQSRLATSYVLASCPSGEYFSDEEEVEVLDSVYLIMIDRIKQWKFACKSKQTCPAGRLGLSGRSDGKRLRFSFYYYNLKIKDVLKEKRKKEKEDDRNRMFKMWSQEKGFTYEKIIKQMYQAKLKKIKN